MGRRRGGSCDTLFRQGCTFIFTAIWLTWGSSVCLLHVAVVDVVPVLKAFPNKIRSGFYTVLSFESLEDDAKSIKGACMSALNKCGRTSCVGVSAYDCSTVDCLFAADTSADLDMVKAAFTRSLNIIMKVTKDKYFGIDGLEDTAIKLDKIVQDVTALNTNEVCVAQNQVYCTIYDNAEQIVNGADTVQDEIDGLVEHRYVRYYKRYDEYLNALHSLPYVLGISLLFYLIFWFRDAACCICSDGSCCGCCALCCHLIFWLLALIPAGTIGAVGYMLETDRIKVPMLEGKPTVGVLIAHIKLEYPEFYEIVIEPLIAPLKALYIADQVFLVVALGIIVYGCGIVVCRPYTNPGDISSVQDESDSIVPEVKTQRGKYGKDSKIHDTDGKDSKGLGSPPSTKIHVLSVHPDV